MTSIDREKNSEKPEVNKSQVSEWETVLESCAVLSEREVARPNVSIQSANSSED